MASLQDRAQEFRDDAARSTPPANWLNFDNYVDGVHPRQDAPGLRQHRRSSWSSRSSARSSSARWPRTRSTGSSFRGKRLVVGAVPARDARARRDDPGRDVPDRQRPRAVQHPLVARSLLFMGTDIVSIYIFLQFMRAIPRSLDEAATIDGANALHDLLADHPAAAEAGDRDRRHHQGHRHLQRVLHPVPLHAVARPAASISTSLFRFKGPFGTQWEVISAGVDHRRSSRPSSLFLFLQRFIYNGFTSGATK